MPSLAILSRLGVLAGHHAATVAPMFHMPMSSPMMTTMLGFLSCADARGDPTIPRHHEKRRNYNDHSSDVLHELPPLTFSLGRERPSQIVSPDGGLRTDSRRDTAVRRLRLVIVKSDSCRVRSRAIRAESVTRAEVTMTASSGRLLSVDANQLQVSAILKRVGSLVYSRVHQL